jgi:hypothetical protein
VWGRKCVHAKESSRRCWCVEEEEEEEEEETRYLIRAENVAFALNIEDLLEQHVYVCILKAASLSLCVGEHLIVSQIGRRAVGSALRRCV